MRVGDIHLYEMGSLKAFGLFFIVNLLLNLGVHALLHYLMPPEAVKTVLLFSVYAFFLISFFMLGLVMIKNKHVIAYTVLFLVLAALSVLVLLKTGFFSPFGLLGLVLSSVIIQGDMSVFTMLSHAFSFKENGGF